VSTDRQVNPCAEAAGHQEKLNITAVSPRSRAGDWEAQADPAPIDISGRVGPVERLEHPFKISARQAGARVSDIDSRQTALKAQVYAGLPIVLQGVVHQIDEQSLERGGIALDCYGRRTPAPRS
jgi:hypothetical protein